MADGFSRVDKKRSGNSWECPKCHEWCNPGRTVCFRRDCGAKRPKKPTLLNTTAEWKRKRAADKSTDQMAPAAKAKPKAKD